jgi:uncharacterized protein YndB with AHSA1/START domain
MNSNQGERAVTEAAVQPIRKQIMVEAPQERAFRVFTQNIDSWWPREHHIGKAELKSAMLEPRSGGRWYEVGVDGSECEWGKVLVWEPPQRLVLAWQITSEWQYDAKFVTEVEVRFTAEGPKRTRVDFEHRNFERFGDAAQKQREMMDSEGGWGRTLLEFAKRAAG